MSTCVNKYLGGREAANRRFPGPVAADHKIFIATNTNICPHSEAHTDYKTEINLQTKRTFTSFDEKQNNDCSNLQVSQEEKTLPLPCHKDEEQQ